MRATISVWGPAEGVRTGYQWSALIGKPSRPWVARVDCMCWRNYKSCRGALAAAKRTLGRLMPDVELIEPS